MKKKKSFHTSILRGKEKGSVATLLLFIFISAFLLRLILFFDCYVYAQIL